MSKHLFNGPEYVPGRDNARLTSQIERVYHTMLDTGWRTLAGISQITGDPPASVSAQLRHLRKERFGGHTVERRHLGDGLFEYRLVASPCGLLSGARVAKEAQG
jgi:hypothetical protein